MIHIKRKKTQRTARHAISPSLLLCLCLAVLLSVSSCANKTSRTFASLDSAELSRGTDWQSAFVLLEGQYQVKTNTNTAVAQRSGRFLNTALNAYNQATGLETTHLPTMNVYVYARRTDYEQQARKLDLPRRITSGFYSPEPPAAMHVPWDGREGEHPLLTMAHEGFHQFIHQVTVNDPLVNPPGRDDILPVLLPIWLNEGLAQFVEGAVVNEDHFDLGQINPARLEHLQQQIRRNRCPDLSSLIGRRYGEPFSQADYSAAWGVTFALYHGLNAAGQWKGPSLLPSLVARLRSASLERRSVGWVAWQADLSRQVLRSLLEERGERLADWEREWQQAMLALNVDDPLGGLAKE